MSVFVMVATQMKEEWRSTTMDLGVLSVMTRGITKMLWWCAASWDTALL